MYTHGHVYISKKDMTNVYAELFGGMVQEILKHLFYLVLDKEIKGYD